MKKQIRYIDIILLFVQTVLFVLAGIFSGNCHYPVWVNLTLNALVILEAVAALFSIGLHTVRNWSLCFRLCCLAFPISYFLYYRFALRIR